MKKRRYLLVLLLSVVFSCTERIELPTKDFSPTIVIYGILTDEVRYQEIKISRSSPYFAPVHNEGVSRAQVVVNSSDNLSYLFTEDSEVSGLYRSTETFSVRGGIDYFLSVDVDFNGDGKSEKYEAVTSVLSTITLDSLSFETIKLFGYKSHILYAHFQDAPGESYYLFNVIHNDSLLTSKLSSYLISDDAIFRDQYTKGNLYRFDDISNQSLDSEEIRQRSVYLNLDDSVEVQICLIEKDYFDFISQCQSEQGGENPMFGGPPSNIITNISNGGVGFFAGYSVSGAKIVFK